MRSIQRRWRVNLHTSSMTGSYPGLSRLIATMATLRGPDGCPWDREQTHASLVEHLLEETFELIEALEEGAPGDIREELGDVLYQVLFHADIAAAYPDDAFDIDDVAADVEAKMRERHPHVFADGGATTTEEVVQRWQEIKAEQKKHRATPFEGIPEKLSALARAQSVLKRGGVAAELRNPPTVPETEEELGELLLGIVQSARAQGLDPERALRTRVRAIEAGWTPPA